MFMIDSLIPLTKARVIKLYDPSTTIPWTHDTLLIINGFPHTYEARRNYPMERVKVHLFGGTWTTLEIARKNWRVKLPARWRYL